MGQALCKGEVRSSAPLFQGAKVLWSADVTSQGLWPLAHVEKARACCSDLAFVSSHSTVAMGMWASR